MFLIYDWLRESKSIGQYFFRGCLFILYIILIICSVAVINKIILNYNRDYVLISMTKFNSNFIIGLLISIILAIYCYIDITKFVRKFKLGRNIENCCSLGFIIGLIMIILGLVYFCNNYYVFYNDKIEKHSILGTTMYSYKDIKSTNTGYKEIRYDKYLYYKVNFKNGESIDIANGLVLEPTEKNAVLEIDKIIRKTK